MSFNDPLIERAQRILKESRAIRGAMSMVTPRLMGMAIEDMPAAEARLEQAEQTLRAVRLDMEEMRFGLGAAVGHLTETTSLVVGQEHDVTDLAQLVQLMTVAFEGDPDTIAVFLNSLGLTAFHRGLRLLQPERIEELATTIEAVRAE